MPESSPTLGADSTFAGKDLSPYWSDSIAGDKLRIVVANRDRLARFGR